MKKDGEFRRWSVDKSDLFDLTLVKARDLIIKCFYEAQKENLLRARKQLGIQASDDDTYTSVVIGIRLAFKEADGLFERPTRESLNKVLEILAKKSASWGAPEDIIEHHKKQIRKILGHLAE